MKEICNRFNLELLVQNWFYNQIQDKNFSQMQVIPL